MGQHARLYDTARWRKRRKRQLSEHPLCKMCLSQNIITPATIADHVEKHEGNHELFFYGELQSLCKTHHDATKQREEIKGYSGATDAQGWPVDPRHPSNAKRL